MRQSLAIRRCLKKMPVAFWNPRERPPLREIYCGLIKLRREHPAYRNDQRHLAAQFKRGGRGDIDAP